MQFSPWPHMAKETQPKIEKKLLMGKYEIDQDGYVEFGDIARGEMDMQSQYASRYVDGSMSGYPSLGEGLRFKGDTDNYHLMKIHHEDVGEFLKRFRKHEEKRY